MKPYIKYEVGRTSKVCTFNDLSLSQDGGGSVDKKAKGIFLDEIILIFAEFPLTFPLPDLIDGISLLV